MSRLMNSVTHFYAPQTQEFIKKQRSEARKLKESRWWKEKVSFGLCYYCEGKFEPQTLTMDHKIPIARGGVSSKNNIVACCKDCNTKKQSQSHLDFQEIFKSENNSL